MAEFVVFWIGAPVALGAALAMVLMRNAVHAALMLVLNFFVIAVFYAVLEAQFLATIQVIVYAGAIMVLFLFVLMLLGVHRDDPGGSRLPRMVPVATVLGVALFAVLAVTVGGPYLSAEDACPDSTTAAADQDGEAAPACRGLAAANEPGNVKAVGRLIFTDYVWPFEVTSLLLIIAALGAMVLGRKSEQPEDLVDRLARAEPKREELDADPAMTDERIHQP